MSSSTKQREVISKSALAHELKVTRGCITAYVKAGMPVREDGLVDRTIALAWIESNVLPYRGGWEVRDKQSAVKPSEVDRAFEQGWMAMSNRLRETTRMEEFARYAIRLGCDIRQAFGLVRWFDIAIVFAASPSDPDEDWVLEHEQPDWKKMAAEAGTAFRPAEWTRWAERLRLKAQRVPELAVPVKAKLPQVGQQMADLPKVGKAKSREVATKTTSPRHGLNATRNATGVVQ